MNVKIETLMVGPLEVNCHIVSDGENPEAMVVDPGGDAGRIIQSLDAASLQPKWLVLTHGHADHILALAEVKGRYPGARVAAHVLDAPALQDPERNLSLMLGMPLTAPPAERMLSEGDELAVGALRFRVLHTPGHTPGGICLVVDTDPPVLLSGDALFAGSVGRSDFPGGDHAQLIESIRTRLLVLPDATRVLSGHGPETTIQAERQSNPFLC